MDFGPVITSRTNARVKELRASLSGKAAAPGDLLGLEGEHLLAEAARSGLSLDTLFVREGSESVAERGPLLSLRARSRVVLSRDVFDSAVETQTPQGIAATWRIAEPALPEPIDGVVLLLEGLQDPGNLGTILRSAEAFGAQMVMMTQHSVGQWNPKTLRASAGSAFRVPVLRGTLKDLDEKLRGAKVRKIAAVVEKAKSKPSYEVRMASPCALMIGNEGAGLSADAVAMADELVRIPCEVESLNAAVAASVLLYEAERQRLARDAKPPMPEQGDK
jgi:TrmH family RNA methyltransferase